MKLLKMSAGILFMLALLAACGSPKQNETKANQASTKEKEIVLTVEQFTGSGMELGKIKPRKFSQRIQATGMLDVPPQYKAAVSAYYGGTVKDVHLLVGQKVNRGATLFTLENPDYVQMQQDYFSAKSQLNYLRAEYERQKQLLQDNVASKKKFLKAESDYLTMLADYRALDKKLRLLNIDPQTLTTENLSSFVPIKAPISGFVTAVNITKGKYLSPNQVAVSLVSTKHLHLELNVFEKDIMRIHKGQPIRFRLPENGSHYFEAEVFLVGKAVSERDRSINVHGHLHSPLQTIRFIPGMYIEAEILVNETLAPALPTDAVVNVGKAYYVLQKKSFSDGHYVFVQRPVKVGLSNDGYIQILNAKTLGDADILVKGAFELIQ